MMATTSRFTSARGVVGYSVRLALSWIILAASVLAARAAEFYQHPRTVEAFLVAQILFGEVDSAYAVPAVYAEPIAIPDVIGYYHSETNSISIDIAEIESRDTPDDMVYYVLVHEIAHSILQQDGIPPERHHEIIYPALMCRHSDLLAFLSPAYAYRGRNGLMQTLVCN